MIPLSSALPALTSDALCLYSTKDALLDNLPVLIFLGPASAGNSTQNNSRIQAHVYSLAGFQSFSRFTVSPTSPLYAAVGHLPAEQQGDEVSRGLAMSLLSYFAGLPKELKSTLRDRAARSRPDGIAPMMFDEMHAGDLAASMEQIEDRRSITGHVMSALSRQVLSWINMDVILPAGTIQRAMFTDGMQDVQMVDDGGLLLFNYGQYASIIDQFGSSTFLPTSRLQRAPSRPTAHSKSKILSKDQKISLRREMCELIDTESSYVGKIRELVRSVATEFRLNSRSDIVNDLFPGSLTEILNTNEAFFNDLQSILDETENEAIRDIEGSASSDGDLGSPVTQGRRRDPTGATLIAKALLRWFPKFMTAYQDYLQASTKFSIIIAQALSDISSGISTQVRNFGEQRLRSALIEPVQRLPRYSLFIDNMVALLPAFHPALMSLLKARDVITDICALDASPKTDVTRSARILNSLVADWPSSYSPPGRLITAVDVMILRPPYAIDCEEASGVLLLFPNTVCVLQKLAANAISARGIIAEFDHPTTRTSMILACTLNLDQSLRYVDSFDLYASLFSESEDGKIIRIIPSTFSTNSGRSTKVFHLLGSYDGKAARLGEEIAKARMETRYSEALRDSGKWALRSISPSKESIGVLLALSESQPELGTITARDSCPIVLYIDGPQDTKSIISRGSSVNVAACITTSGAGIYKLDTEGADGTLYTDQCSSENLTGVLVARSKLSLTLTKQLILTMSSGQPRSPPKPASELAPHRVKNHVPSRSPPIVTIRKAAGPYEDSRLSTNLTRKDDFQFLIKPADYSIQTPSQRINDEGRASCTFFYSQQFEDFKRSSYRQRSIGQQD